MRVETRYQLIRSESNEEKAFKMIEELNKKRILTYYEIGPMDINIKTTEFVEDNALCKETDTSTG